MVEKIRHIFFQKMVPVKTFLVRTFIGARMQRRIRDLFHRIYVAYPERTLNTSWMGVRVIKCPFDLWVYQEILFDQRPDVIIETGTLDGGSALYLAHLCDLVENGRVLTIDKVANKNRPQHPRIKYILGDSTDPAIVAQVRRHINEQDTVIVILDSDHSWAHVRRELEMYSGLVTRGSYLIVEDTHINGHPIRPELGPGPMEAVEEFLQAGSQFVADRSREKFFMSFNYRGYLRRL